jgi:hypothetical protein
MASEKDRIGNEITAAVRQVLERNNVRPGSYRKAPIHVHKMLDALMATDADPTRSAPGWAHDLLDFIWDLFS